MKLLQETTLEKLALSVRPPWAYPIVYGMPIYKSIPNGDGTTSVELDKTKRLFKNIENRSWPLPKTFKIPQRIVIHVGTRQDSSALEWMLNIGLSPMASMLMHSKKLPTGAFIGEVDVVDCVTKSKNPWFMGKYGFVLENPMPFAEPIPFKGRLGFFRVPAGILDEKQKEPANAR